MTNAPHDDLRKFASSPCYADEMRNEPYGRGELLSLLNELLKSERAGARGLNELSKRPHPPELVALLQALAQDEGRFCVMLRGHIKRLGGIPSDATGTFFEKLITREGLGAQISLLDRGQSAVVRMLAEMLPRLQDDDLYTDLQEMHDVHVVNIEKANQQVAPFVESE
ncbi:MAG: DUF6306 domain-containing protein [Pseudomonadaceae bacterium]|nr:DUF6306 domain-containing protein [Pseudomonadaceae bacterium]